MDNSEFCHLHIHNEYSALDGLGKAKDWAKKASAMGFKYLGLTNHGNVDGAINFQKACKKQKIKPIAIKEKFLEKKPNSLNPTAWDSYSEETFNKIKSGMSPQTLEKIREELNKRKNPQVGENLKEVDAEIKRLKKMLARNPSDKDTRERLMELLEVRAKCKYLREIFLK